MRRIRLDVGNHQGTDVTMPATSRVWRRCIGVWVVLAAATPLSQAHRPAPAHTASAALSVSVTVVRGCLVETDPRRGVGITCTGATETAVPQPPEPAATAVLGSPAAPRPVVAETRDGRVVIQF